MLLWAHPNWGCNVREGLETLDQYCTALIADLKKQGKKPINMSKVAEVTLWKHHFKDVLQKQKLWSWWTLYQTWILTQSWVPYTSPGTWPVTLESIVSELILTVTISWEEEQCLQHPEMPDCHSSWHFERLTPEVWTKDSCLGFTINHAPLVNKLCPKTISPVSNSILLLLINPIQALQADNTTKIASVYITLAF